MATPDTIPGLVSWFKADAITGLSNGDLIETWVDSSAVPYNATQATAAKRPTYQTAVRNGLPGVLFDGADDWLQSDGSTSLPAQTIIAVIRAKDSSGNKTIRGANASGGLQVRLLATERISLVKQAVAVIGEGAASLSTLTDYVVSASYATGSSWFTYINGAQDATGTSAQSYTSGRLTHLGGNSGTSEFWNSHLFEVIGYDSVLSAADRAIVHSYLQDKWAIPVADYVGGSTPTRNLQLGAAPATALRLGATTASRAYLGGSLVFEA